MLELFRKIEINLSYVVRYFAYNSFNIEIVHVHMK